MIHYLRSKYRFLALTSLVFVSIFGCKEIAQENSQVNLTKKEVPNIILLMADDQGWGDVGYNGHPYLKTPNLDDMASNGVQFNRFYAASAVCSPTRGSVMTGRHPLRYGICHANCGHIKPQEVTIAEMLKDKEYATGHFGKWHLGTLTRDTLDANRGGNPKYDMDYAPPWENGFDVSFVTESKVPTWNPMVTPSKTAGDVKSSLIEGEPFNTFYWTGPGKIETENLEGDDSRVIMDRVIPFITKAVEKEQPFFTIIWFHTPHLPVLTGDTYSQEYKELSVDQQQYYGVLTALDEQVGRLRNELRKLQIEENTVLFYTSDNGPEGKNIKNRTQGITKGLKGRKRSLYEGGIRVPGILEWPGRIKPGKKVEEPCFTSDYFPTIAEIVGVDLKKYNRPFDGESLLPIVENTNAKRKNNFAFSFQEQRALIGREYKIYSSDGERGSFELYNILNDPFELVDLSKEEPKILDSMVSELNNWLASVEKSAQGKDY